MLRHTLICIAGSLMLTTVLVAQQPTPQRDTTSAKNHQMMMQRVQAADARLDRLLIEMNRATGARKVQAMAAVINEMVAQRKQMRDHMMQMMHSGGMMRHGRGPAGRMGEPQPVLPDSTERGPSGNEGADRAD